MRGKRACQPVSAGAPAAKRPQLSQAAIAAASSTFAQFMPADPYGMMLWQQMQIQYHHQQAFIQQQMQARAASRAAMKEAQAHALAAALIGHAAKPFSTSRINPARSYHEKDGLRGQDAEPLSPEESKDNVMEDAAAAALALASLSCSSDKSASTKIDELRSRPSTRPSCPSAALASIYSCPLLNRDLTDVQ
eukprot:TRINITY_DN7024_c0_g2_i1.p1 TRINITY_DN7024_c0_g2~~TRINITY_DN7024_c0_g2_i1.p1  ORF type:complete len:192 (+),score=35.60 TRINITY_DN7024_c0_g2_i1:632-1207(+)